MRQQRTQMSTPAPVSKAGVGLGSEADISPAPPYVRSALGSGRQNLPMAAREYHQANMGITNLG